MAVENPGTRNAKFTWTKATLLQPIILKPTDGFVVKEDDKTDNKVEKLANRYNEFRQKAYAIKEPGINTEYRK